MTVPVEGIEEGEVEYEMTREQWERRARRTNRGHLLAQRCHECDVHA
jgi:hypothetical protein